MDLQRPVKPIKVEDSTDKFDVRMKCWPIKQEDELNKIKFSSKVQFSDESYKDKLLSLRLSELLMGKTQQLLISKEYGNFKGGLYNFNPFEFTSDIFKSQSPLAMKTLVIEILETDKKDAKKVKIVGKT